MNQPTYNYILKNIAVIAGAAGIFTWVYMTAGSRDDDERGPRIGWQMFDDWRDFDQWWNFFLAPIAAFVIPALLVLILGLLGKFIFRLIGSNAPAPADDQEQP